jgi:hypothetical protein
VIRGLTSPKRHREYNPELESPNNVPDRLLGMQNATSGSKMLSPSRPNYAVIAQAISVPECTFEKVRHRLETLMRMLRERRRRSYGELIQQNERIVWTFVKRGEKALHFGPCSFPHPYGTASPEHYEAAGTNSKRVRQNC